MSFRDLCSNFSALSRWVSWHPWTNCYIKYESFYGSKNKKFIFLMRWLIDESRIFCSKKTDFQLFELILYSHVARWIRRFFCMRLSIFIFTQILYIAKSNLSLLRQIIFKKFSSYVTYVTYVTSEPYYIALYILYVM